MRSTLLRSFSDLYNELKEEDMNISYNSLSECLNLVADQFTSFTELFNPLVSRAKLLANPLFRSDVMANDKLKKWGKGVLQKTKAMATLLSPPTEQDRSSSGSTGLPQSPRIQSSDEDMMIAKPTSRGKFSPEISLTRQQSSNFGDASPDDGKHGNKGFFSRIFKSKKKDVSRERALSPRGSAPSLFQRDGSRDSLLGSPREDAFPSGSFDPFSEGRLDEVSLQRRSSEGGRFRCVSPRVRRSHRHYRSFSDDVSGGPGLEEASRLWLNVSGGGGERRGGPREHYRSVRSGLHSPPPAQGESESDDLLDMGERECEGGVSIPEGYGDGEGYGEGYGDDKGYGEGYGMYDGYDDQDGSSDRYERDRYDDDDQERYHDDDQEDDILGGYHNDNHHNDNHHNDILDGYSDDTYNTHTHTPTHERYSDMHEFNHLHDNPTDNHALNDNLIDLSAINVTQPCGVAPKTVAPMSPPTDTTRIPDISIDAKVKKSRVARMERLLGKRTVPPFRRRVAFLPPLPLATAQDASEKPKDGKQVRFFTNVICHEYRSY